MTVTFSPILAFRRPMGPGPCTWATAAATVGGPAALRFSTCGCGTYSKISAMRFLHGRWGRKSVGVPSGIRLLGRVSLLRADRQVLLDSPAERAPETQIDTCLRDVS